MQPTSRRGALQHGGAGLAAGVIGGGGVSRELPSRFDPVG